MAAKKTKKRSKKRARKKEAPVTEPTPATDVEDALSRVVDSMPAAFGNEARESEGGGWRYSEEDGLNANIMLQREERCGAELSEIIDGLDYQREQGETPSEFSQIVNAINAQGLITRRDAWRIAAHHEARWAEQNLRHGELLKALSNLGKSVAAVGQALQAARRGE